MYEFKINIKKNAILIVLKGRMEADEAWNALEKLKSGIDRLKPGFAIITDLSNYIPVSENVRTHIKAAMEYAVTHKVGRIIRIVPDDNPASNIGGIQFNRTSQEVGYKAEHAASLEEAKQMLGWY